MSGSHADSSGDYSGGNGGRKRKPKFRSGEAPASEYNDKRKESYAEEDRKEGIIKIIVQEKGYGFIQCHELPDQYQGDVFVHEKFLNGFSVGDRVLFNLRKNAKGQPQASDLQPAPVDIEPGFLRRGMQNLEHDDYVEAPSEVNIGTIKYFDEGKGYGFISCPELQDEFNGMDIFVHKKQINGFKVGDTVWFSLQVNNRGQPQAVDLSAFDPTSASSPGFSFHAGPIMYDGRLMHEGVVKKVDEEKGYGFLFSEDLLKYYGSDVYVEHKHLVGFAVGDHVLFAVKVNKRGKPQAVDLQHMSQATAAEFSDGFQLPSASSEVHQEEEPEKILSGTIKSYDEKQGYGFISSEQALLQYNRDVFVHSKQIKDFRPGDNVRFRVRMNNQGQPQAYEVCKATKSLLWLEGCDEEAPISQTVAPAPAAPVEHRGTIKSFSDSKGYGFIDCPALKVEYSRDIFMNKFNFEGLQVGDTVLFTMYEKNGQPQAKNVRRTAREAADQGSAEPTAVARVVNGSSSSDSPSKVKLSSSTAAPGGSSVAAPSGSAGSGGGGNVRSAGGSSTMDSEELDRRLIRACQSTRVESLGQVEELLAMRADPNTRDVTGQFALMTSALNVRHNERKCRFLLEARADVNLMYRDNVSVLQWARERIDKKFAHFLQAVSNGEADVSVTAYVEPPPEEF